MNNSVLLEVSLFALCCSLIVDFVGASSSTRLDNEIKSFHGSSAGVAEERFRYLAKNESKATLVKLFGQPAGTDSNLWIYCGIKEEGTKRPKAAVLTFGAPSFLTSQVIVRDITLVDHAAVDKISSCSAEKR